MVKSKPQKKIKNLEQLEKVVRKDNLKRLGKKADKLEKKIKTEIKKHSKKLKIVVSQSLKDVHSKTCPKCKKNKKMDQFGTRTITGKKYAQSQCKDCR